MEDYIKRRIAELTLEKNNATMDFNKLLKQKCIDELEGCLEKIKTERDQWLEDAIEEFIVNKPDMDGIDITTHFKLKTDIVLKSLHQLEKDSRIKRRECSGIKFGFHKI